MQLNRSGVHGVESVCRMSKCEMAKLLNKETCFKEMLDKRDQIIKGLDQKIKEMEKEQKSKTRSELFLLLCVLSRHPPVRPTVGLTVCVFMSFYCIYRLYRLDNFYLLYPYCKLCFSLALTHSLTHSGTHSLTH